jgi:hypothetical protein
MIYSNTISKYLNFTYNLFGIIINSIKNRFMNRLYLTCRLNLKHLKFLNYFFMTIDFAIINLNNLSYTYLILNFNKLTIFYQIWYYPIFHHLYHRLFYFHCFTHLKAHNSQVFSYSTIQNYRKIIFTCAHDIPLFGELFISVAKNKYLNTFIK